MTYMICLFILKSLLIIYFFYIKVFINNIFFLCHLLFLMILITSNFNLFIYFYFILFYFILFFIFIFFYFIFYFYFFFLHNIVVYYNSFVDFSKYY